jgi:hypothetical protein
LHIQVLHRIADFATRKLVVAIEQCLVPAHLGIADHRRRELKVHTDDGRKAALSWASSVPMVQVFRSTSDVVEKPKNNFNVWIQYLINIQTTALK